MVVRDTHMSFFFLLLRCCIWIKAEVTELRRIRELNVYQAELFYFVPDTLVRKTDRASYIETYNQCSVLTTKMKKEVIIDLYSTQVYFLR